MLRREAAVQEVAGILTPREIELTRMITGGLRNREIGERLSITEGTVKIHLHHIYGKLKLSGRRGLSVYARTKEPA